MTPPKALQGLRGIPVIHCITGLGNGGRQQQWPGGAALSLYSYLGNKCFKVGKEIKLGNLH